MASKGLRVLGFAYKSLTTIVPEDSAEQQEQELVWLGLLGMLDAPRPEVKLSINQIPAQQYSSQGQQRTLVLALKLAELQLIEEVVGEPPLLLLDDVLAELDLLRQNQLLDTIQDHFQTLITTTHLGAFDAQWLHSSQILHVYCGKVISE
ncbi:DNA recombination and repair protein RecF [Richelia intracellularis HM01]|nr:DNA recombination and repair protein RecF [Richelia intracellularis HM01]